jgi:hypothetical protein
MAVLRGRYGRIEPVIPRSHEVEVSNFFQFLEVSAVLLQKDALRCVDLSDEGMPQRTVGLSPLSQEA